MRFDGKTKALAIAGLLALGGSFLYRYLPRQPGDLDNGKLQVLQVLNAAGTPVTQASQTPVQSADQAALHTYGRALATRWVTIHDTAVDGHAPFNANTAAKAQDGTPFKRPENGLFRPGSKFEEFFFDETGDTNATSVENDCCGGWESVFELRQADPSASTGRLTLFFKGDEAHAGFDNVAFLSKDLVTFGEDAGDTLHRQRNALDSGFVLDVTKDYSDPANQPLRWLAEGRDASATIDAAAVPTGFGKNAVTTRSPGSTSPTAIRRKTGSSAPTSCTRGRATTSGVFYTQQHGDNVTYEVIRAR
jgi:hypothetical protein